MSESKIISISCYWLLDLTMRFELSIENHSCLFYYMSFFEVLNDVNEIEIFLFSERWFVFKWEFVIENMIAIIKWIINESDSNCKCINNVDAKMMLHY